MQSQLQEYAKRANILVVDDNPANLQLISQMLSERGYSVRPVLDGALVLQAAKVMPPDLILLDVNMPGMSGYEVCQLLKQEEKTQDIPVIFLSALDSVDDKIKAFEAGGVDYVTKPFFFDEVLARIEAHIALWKLQQQIQEAGEQDWQATFNAVEDLIILTDPEFHITRSNKTATWRLQQIFTEVEGKYIGEVFFDEALTGAARGSDTDARVANLRGEIQFPRMEGWYDVRSYPVQLGGLLSGYVFIIKDITLNKHMEDTMTASQRLADLGTLAAGITHDIKSPLQVITGLSERWLRMLDRGEIDLDTLRRDAENINRNGWRIEKISRSLLAYARRSDDEMEHNDLNDIVCETLLLIEHQLLSWGNISVHSEFARNIPTYLCHRNQISQALINLLTNARDAMPAGGDIYIRTRFEEPEKQIVLEVADTGSGVDQELQENIFEPFFTTKPRGQGTGLGLSIVANIVRSYGGDISIKSRPGRGATFVLVFPIMPDEERTEALSD